MLGLIAVVMVSWLAAGVLIAICWAILRSTNRWGGLR